MTLSVPPNIFDRKLLKLRQQRIAKNFSDFNFLHERAFDTLYDRLLDVTRTFDKGVISAKDTPAVRLTDIKKRKSLSALYTMNLLLNKDRDHIHGDEEFFPFGPNTLDLVISNLTLHAINDLPGSLIQIRSSLKPDGLFLASMFGGETLFELRDCLTKSELHLTGGISPRIFPFADKQQMGGLMQRTGYALPVVDSDIFTVTYSDVGKLFKDLRGMGENNIITQRRKSTPPRKLFQKAEEIYKSLYAEKDGRIRATFEIIYLTGWSPHTSQQKPLQPGSAQYSLAERLGTKEIKTSELKEPC